jgi:hypothetical protein
MLDALMLRVRMFAVGLLFAVVPGIATAQIVLFDIEADPKAWAKAIDKMPVLGSWDFSTLPDFGVSSMEGPLTSAGGGPIPPGFIPSIVQIDSSRFFPDEPITLAFIGPSANGSDNTENAVVPNQAQDSFNIFFLNSCGRLCVRRYKLQPMCRESRYHQHNRSRRSRY